MQERRRQGYVVFSGIPYAQPSLGALRFAAPRAADQMVWNPVTQGPRVRCPSGQGGLQWTG